MSSAEPPWISSTFLGVMSSWVRSALGPSAPLPSPLKPRDTDPMMILPMRMMPMKPDTAMAPMPMGLMNAPKMAEALILPME